MRYKTAIAITIFMLSFIFSYAQNNPDVSSNAVRDIDQRLEAALSSSDVAALDQILAPEYIEIDSQGDVRNREQLLAFARARKAGPAAQIVGPEKTVNDHTIRVHGGTAISVTLTSMKFQFMDYQTSGPPPAQGPEFVDQERRLRVYHRTAGRWQLVAQQTTAVAKR